MYPYFSHSMGAFFPLDSHFMVYFITWEIHVFSHQFPITWEKTAKSIELWKPGKLIPGNILQNPSYVENLRNWYSHFPHSMGGFFPLDSHLMVYFITWEMHGFSHKISHSIRKVSKTHWIGKAWEIGSNTFSIKRGIPLDFHPLVCFIIWEMHGFSHQFLIAWQKTQKNPSNGKTLANWLSGKSCKNHGMWKTWEIGTHTFPIVWMFFSH